MQNKTNLSTHNEVISSEPWHRGSGFTWMLLALAGAVFFFSASWSKAQVSITEGYVIINGGPNLGDYYYELKDNGGNNTEFGTVNISRNLLSSPALTLKGGEVKTSSANGDYQNTSNTMNLDYRVYRNGVTPGSFTSLRMDNMTDTSWPTYQYDKTGQNIALLNGLDSGTWKIDAKISGNGSWWNGSQQFYAMSDTATSTATVELFYGATSGGSQSSAFTGTGYFSLNSAGNTYTLGQANTYTGETRIDAGTVSLSGSLNSASKVFVGNGGNSDNAGLTLSGTTALANDVQVNTGSGTRTITKSDGTSQTMSGAFTNNKASTVNVASSSGNLTMSGVASGSGDLTKTGDGVLALTGSSANTRTGVTEVSGGTLVLNKSAGVNAVAGQTIIGSSGAVRTDAANQFGGNYVTNNGGTLNLNNNNQTLALAGSGTVSLGSAQMTLNNTGSDTFSGAITGTGSVVKAGTGTQTLTGNNTYSGGTTISGGTLVGNTTSIQGAVANNAALELSQNTDGTYSGALSGAGTLVKKGTGNVTLGSSNSGYSGGVYIDAGTLSAGEGAGFGTGSVFLGQDGVSSTATVAIGDANGGTSVGNDVVVRAGGGTRTITSANTSGSNTFSGNVYLDGNVSLSSSTGGRLILSGRLDDGLGAGNFTATITAGSVEFAGSSSNQNLTSYTVNSGAELRMNKSSADAVQSTLNINSGGTATLVAANQLGSGATVNNSGTLATGGNSDTFGTLNSSGDITGSGTLTAGTYSITGGTVSANLGNGTLTASGNSTINGNTTASTMNVTGDTTLNGTSSATTVAVSGNGTDLNLGSGGNRLSSSADVTVGAGSKLNITSNQALGSVKETGTSNGGEVNIGSGAKLTINGADKGTLFQNTISGAGDLEMAGSGSTSLALYGTQSYTGSTTVSGGKISTAVALATAGVTVSGGTFETTAADILGNGASVNISSGTYSLGGSDTVGSLTISGGSLTGTSTLTAATYALQGGTVGANLGAGAATASSGTTALNGNLGGSLTASGGTVNAVGTIGGNVTVSGGTVNLNGADRISNTSAVSISSGTLGMGANNDTVGSFNISGGTLGGTGKLTTSTYGLSGGTVNANLGAGTVNANSGTTALNGTVDATTVNVGGGTLNLGSGGRLAAGATANVTSGTLSTGGNETITRLNATGGTVNLTDDTLTVTGTGGNASSIGAGAEMVGGTIAIGTASANSGRMTINSLDADNTSALSIASGGTLTGSFRTSGALSVDGVFAPGNSTGISYVGATTFLGGGRYEWEVDTFGPGAAVGTNWDFLDISGALTISATSGDKFWIDIISLLASNDQTGEASGFNLTSNYSFAIATAAGGISGFNAGAFGINSEGFLNSVGAGDPLYVSAGSWSVSQQGNSLMLNYSGATAIPEPSSAALTLLGMGVLALRRRCRR